MDHPSTKRSKTFAGVDTLVQAHQIRASLLKIIANNQTLLHKVRLEHRMHVENDFDSEDLKSSFALYFLISKF